MLRSDYVIVGSGFMGCVLAERISTQLNKKVLIIEKRKHIGGNCYDEYDINGILIHRYGPHLFHTNSEKVINYLSGFTKWRKYEHRVLAKYKSEYYQIPINITTVNKYFNINLKTEKELKDFFNLIRIKKNPIKSSEDFVLSKIGYDLYESFYKYYTIKQWNIDPSYLAPNVCERLPIRYNKDNRYFDDKFQCIPLNGYTSMFKNLLDNKNISIMLDSDFYKLRDKIKYGKLIYTGPIDDFLGNIFGKLPYRSIKFLFENYKKNNFQIAPQINYVELKDKFTRVVEYKQITGQSNISTTVSFEYPIKDGEPYYPIPNQDNILLHKKYLNLAHRTFTNVLFCGRLAEYKYYNMDQVVARALHIFEKIIK